MHQRILRVLLVLTCLGFWLNSARAESEARPLPDYDGRGEPPTTPGDVLIWVPRVIVFPIYLVTEYVIRRPLGWLISSAERANVPAFLYDFFTFADHQAGVVPTALLDFGFYPSFGVYAFWNNAFVPNHDMRLHGAFGGGEWLGASLSDRWYLDKARRDGIHLDVRGERRPDFAYFGVGPDTRQSDLTRYGRDLRQLLLGFDVGLWRASSFHAEVGFDAVEFRRGGYDGDPTLADEIEAGRQPLPPGYDGNYRLVHSRLGAALDTRLPRPAPGGGVRVEGFVAHYADLKRDESFLRYGAGGGVSLDLNQRRRVLSLGGLVRFVDPINGAQIPFTELVSLGGTEPMRGLYPGRLYDRSAAVVGLGYRWPVWMWLDGAIRTEVGNVFGEHLSGFRVGRLRWSGAIGVESVGTPDNSFELMFGAGSETFESGGTIDSFRLVLGTTSGF